MMTQAQIKGKIKSIANKNDADPRLLMRIFMMERFLERISVSEYKDNFIIKGGILVTSMIGISMRSTMDIDASIKNINLNEDDIFKIITKICNIDLNDNVKFCIKNIRNIMDNMEYPGIRVEMNALYEKMITPLKIDISTGDVITPKAIEYQYDLLMENRAINLWAYNLETILAEKMQAILSRGVFNTRMRDFYDINILLNVYKDKIDKMIFKQAFEATTQKRNTLDLLKNGSDIIFDIEHNEKMITLWNQYKNKFNYANELDYSDVIISLKELYNYIK